MKVNLAHIRERSTTGGYIDFAVFDAKPTSNTNSAKAEVLNQLTQSARGSGLKVDQSALAYTQNGRTQFYGSQNLVDHLSANGVPRWTHNIDA